MKPRYEDFTMTDQIACRSNQASFRSFYCDRVGCGLGFEDFPACVHSYVRGDEEKWHEIDLDFMDWYTDGMSFDSDEPMIHVMLRLQKMMKDSNTDETAQYLFDGIVAFAMILQAPGYGFDSETLESLLHEGIFQSGPNGEYPKITLAMAKQSHN